MKDWLTAREIAAEQLPDMPATESAVIRLAKREGWEERSSQARTRAGRGGATEYHVSLLPTLAQVAYQQKHIVIQLPVKPARPAPDTSLTDRAQKERDARLAIVAAFEKFSRSMQLGYATRVQVFTDKFNAGSLNIDGWVLEIIPSLSKRSLARWQSQKRDGRVNALAHDPAKARKGTGVLETANGGAVSAFILALIAHQPHLSGHHVRTLCRSEFGDTLKVVSKGVETAIPMPPVRTFQHTLKGLKESHKVELLKLTNPDRYRSHMAPAGVGMLRHITEPNQLWQIDASPVDALCTDGRHAIYACIDIATRRTVWLLSRTPRASAVALLIRKAILEWGVPDVVKTDNGSDFVARDTQRLFASLGIEPETSDAYSPEQKGHVERVIKTFQHDMATLLPGFVGHSVADRKAIESRKSFAQRLGESDASVFGVSLTGPQLQKHVDDWANLVYQHKPHAGLKNATPFAAALASTRPVRKVDERALDLLLMPVAGKDGRRQVTKLGISIDNKYYLAPTVMHGTAVFVRMDPNDAGRAYVFAQDGAEFLGDAICPELSGLHPETIVRAAKEMRGELIDERTRQLKADMKKIAKGAPLIERALEVARRDAPNVVALPKREAAHSTPQISAAIEALGERINPSKPLDPAAAAAHRRLIEEMTRQDEAELFARTDAKLQRRQDEIEALRTAHLPKDTNVVALPETPKERYRRAFFLRQRIEAEEPVIAADAHWLGGYELSPEFKAQQGMHDDFGDAYLS
ncbi:DDE-type integrase/transposase/recombinase [Mesorhizobium sp. B2-4-4]|uniref:DDE-type integrase/transposase/recombinase n=1 Tax=Mesorhizobium sp. B2-4-4 TaxID=2589945 RepID=UPI00112EF6B9|nr:DDE-type integrase/transposase/recombinase [Mesorhizobium sp. B2-4-4]TPL49122.1 DDE-type integrase/transposase/recombinase [Mesorhizobium sp. B2-4-4]